MADYTSRTYYGDVIRTSDGKTVAPVSDASDPDYLAWVAWCDAGNTPDTDDSMPVVTEVPQVVTSRQMFHALDQAGLLDDIEAFVATQPRPVQIDWNKSREFQRDNVLLNAMAPLLGLTQEDLDALFIAADAVV